MGKSKKRIIDKARNDKIQLQLTREAAVDIVVKELEKNPSSNTAKEMITLFGLSAEELSEAGLPYEVLRSLDRLLN